MSSMPQQSGASWQSGSAGSPLSLQLPLRDWQILLELLEAERGQISPEIHHTDTPRVHDALIERKQQLENLRNRIQSAISGNA